MNFFKNLILTIPFVTSDEYNHIYNDDDVVTLWANTVGPYQNRQETYEYFSLPFCSGNFEHNVRYRHHDNIGDALQGVELTNTGMEIRFHKPVASTVYCEIEIDENIYKRFKYAIDNHYWFQMYMDDLPIWGIIGERSVVDKKDVYYLWSHKRLDIGFNGNQIVDITLTSEKKLKMEVGEKIQFSYEINWKSSQVAFKDRYEKYLDHKFFQHRIHKKFLIDR